MAVTAISDEPWMEGDTVDSVGYSNTRKVTLHFSIVYLDVPWPAHITRPVYALGTTLKLSTKYAGQYLTLPPSAIDVGDGPAAGPNTQVTQYIALNEYNIEWDRVQNTAALDFTGFVGSVNADWFLGQPPGTLLCEGASQDHSLVLNPYGPLSWKTTVTFKQRMITIPSGENAGVYGWNHWYNPKTQQWEALTLTNDLPPHQPRALSLMFA